jgi:hypothetical protein
MGWCMVWWLVVWVHGWARTCVCVHGCGRVGRVRARGWVHGCGWVGRVRPCVLVFLHWSPPPSPPPPPFSLHQERQSVSQLQRRYGMGVKSIYSAEELTLSMQTQLHSMQPVLDRNREDTLRVMSEIEAEQHKVDETRRLMEQEQQMCERKALEAHRMKMECEADLASAMPELEGALCAPSPRTSSGRPIHHTPHSQCNAHLVVALAVPMCPLSSLSCPPLLPPHPTPPHPTSLQRPLRP